MEALLRTKPSAPSYITVLSEAFFSVVMPFPISPWIDTSAEICIAHSSRVSCGPVGADRGRSEPCAGRGLSCQIAEEQWMEHSPPPGEPFPKTASTHQALGP